MSRTAAPCSLQVFSPWGVLSGLLFILSAGNAVLAIQQVGLAVASGVWCGVAVLTSFAWATLVGGDHIDRPGQAAAALVLLLAGITGIAGAGAWGSPAQCKDDSHREEDPLLDDEAEGGGPHRCSPRATGTLLGFGAAVAAGALGGAALPAGGDTTARSDRHHRMLVSRAGLSQAVWSIHLRLGCCVCRPDPGAHAGSPGGGAWPAVRPLHGSRHPPGRTRHLRPAGLLPRQRGHPADARR